MRKHGADKRRVWRKVHIVIDTNSHEVRAVEMTDHRHGDGEIVPGLLAQLPEYEGHLSDSDVSEVIAEHEANIEASRGRITAYFRRIYEEACRCRLLRQGFSD